MSKLSENISNETNEPNEINNEIDLENMVTMAEAAQILDCSIRTIRRYISKEYFPAYFKGNKIYITKKDLQDYIKSRKV